MLCNTKLANGCRVTERADIAERRTQHIVETTNGYIIRVIYKHRDKIITLDSVLNAYTYYNLTNRLVVPIGNYKSLRAAYKALMALAPLHNTDHRRRY